MSEDCLTLNVVRDSTVDENANLPVGVWIHGGGFNQGSGSDQRYNMSAIVSNSYKIGKLANQPTPLPKKTWIPAQNLNINQANRSLE